MNIEVPVVNAFTANDKGGNPAGVILDAPKLSDQQMQYIAHEVGASETAFVLPDDNATFRVRFFTPTIEVDLCGHATVATWTYMLEKHSIKPGSYTQNTLAGLINISIDEAGLVFMEQPEQNFKDTLDFKVLAEELGIPEDWINKNCRPQIVQNALMLSLKSKQLLNDFVLDKSSLLALNRKYDFQGLHLFVLLGDGEILAAVRDFDPIVGIDEDAATGTTNGSFLTYLKNYDLLPIKEIYKIEQGEAMGKLSHIYGKFQNNRVWIGGKAKTKKHLVLELE